MKVLRGFLTVILSIILVFTIFGISLSIFAKDLFQGQVFVSLVKAVVQESVKENKELNNKEANAVIDKIADDSDVNEIMEKMVNEYIDYSNNGDGVNDETVELIIKFILNHKKDINDLAGEEVDFSMFESPDAKDQIKREINEAFEELSKEDTEALTAIAETYQVMTSKQTITKAIIVIIALVILIGLVSWSPYKWMTPVGISSIIASVFSFILFSFAATLVGILNANSDLNISLSSNIILIASIIEFILGVTFIVLRNIFENRERENKMITTV